MTRFRGRRLLWEQALVRAFEKAVHAHDGEAGGFFGGWYLDLYHKKYA